MDNYSVVYAAKAKNGMKAYLLSLFVIFGASLYLLWVWPDRQPVLTFCDVGQGDATLVSFGYFQLLIDGGPDQKGLDCVRQTLPFWDRTLEMVVITHMDADHIGGLDEILSQYQAKTILVQPAYQRNSAFSGVAGHIGTSKIWRLTYCVSGRNRTKLESSLK
jgi:beta-lactamase superfamily II metal-dependent hydrolase